MDTTSLQVCRSGVGVYGSDLGVIIQVTEEDEGRPRVLRRGDRVQDAEDGALTGRLYLLTPSVHCSVAGGTCWAGSVTRRRRRARHRAATAAATAAVSSWAGSSVKRPCNIVRTAC